MGGLDAEKRFLIQIANSDFGLEKIDEAKKHQPNEPKNEQLIKSISFQKRPPFHRRPPPLIRSEKKTI